MAKKSVDLSAIAANTQNDVTIIEPGLAKGLTPHETEQALHAMGKDTAPSMAEEIAAAAAGKTIKAPKAPKATKVKREKFDMKATHNGLCLWPGMKMRAEGDRGYPGQKFIMDNPGVTFEEFVAAGFAINHLNWDLNRGWNIVSVAAEDGTAALRKAIRAINAAIDLMMGVEGLTEAVADLMVREQTLQDELAVVGLSDDEPKEGAEDDAE